MRRLAALFFVMISLLTFAPAVAADTADPGGRPRETHEGTGFFAYTSDCDAQSCTDTYVYADEVSTSSGETYESVCVEQYTYSTRTGRTTAYASGCTDTTNLTVTNDLSSATLSPTNVEVCGGRRCETLTVSAELQGAGETATYRSRHSFKDGTCTFTYSDSGHQRFATGTITVDGETTDAQGDIRSYKSTFSERCR